MRAAFVVGVGAVTPLGATWPASRARLAAGESAIAPVHAGFDTTGYPSRAAAAVPLAHDGDDRRRALAERAAEEAIADAGAALEGVAADRIGVFVGAESGRSSFATLLALTRAAGGGPRFDHEAFGRDGARLAPRIDARAVSPAAVASALARRLGARGPAVTVSLACASGAAAIGEAARAIRLGQIDVALAGGVGADVDPFMLAGFGILGALSARGQSCPFDLRRDGFVVGEGAAFAVLAARGPGVRVAGVGRSLDAHHLTAPDPDGAGAELAMRAALRDAGCADVGYVQAHGTSTPLNDHVEALALARVLGPALDRTEVGAVKGAVGHWVAGAGAIGFLCAVEAVRAGLLLPTAGLVDPDPRCPLPHVLGAARRAPVERALVNAFAFGGANACLVVAA